MYSYYVTPLGMTKIADARSIPTYFDYAWARRTGKANPLRYAIQKAHADQSREQDVRNAWRFAGCGMAGFVFSVLSTIFLPGSVPIWLGISALAMVGGSFLLSVLSFGKIFIDRTIYPIEGGDFEAFASAYAQLCQWCGNASATCFIGMSDDKIRAEADRLLIKQAQYQLEFQAANADDPDLQIKLGELMREFKSRYEVLVLFDLASGGYDKYFDKARALVAEKQAAIATSPSSA